MKTRNLVSKFIVVVIVAFLSVHAAHAAPLLRCTVSYYGTSHLVDARLAADPYDILSMDIEGRFRFKAVMVGAQNKIAYIKLYAYLQTESRDIPIHQATYLPPFTLSAKPKLLTPMNHLYADDYERELQYHCTLQNRSSAQRAQP